ncbi:uncharacterized protein LOC134529898 [Bacillus rossius redtenbacheri]|uniref:uncharacterized protein LOC134529898 n=1 Tax=Bacillus rossius redtenbacheri TaxID=93214 RepID=UPI002FDDD77F
MISAHHGKPKSGSGEFARRQVVLAARVPPRETTESRALGGGDAGAFTENTRWASEAERAATTPSCEVTSVDASLLGPGREVTRVQGPEPTTSADETRSDGIKASKPVSTRPVGTRWCFMVCEYEELVRDHCGRFEEK